jgi:hypothetical protein
MQRVLLSRYGRAVLPCLKRSVSLHVSELCSKLAHDASSDSELNFLVGAVSGPEMDCSYVGGVPSYVGGVTQTPAAVFKAIRSCSCNLCVNSNAGRVTVSLSFLEFQDRTQIHNYNFYCKVVRTAL